MQPRILVLSASVGAGHLRAAQAVELALRQTVPDAEVRNVDVLQLTNAAFRKVYGKLYLDLVNKAPHVLGYFYDRMDRPSKSGKNRSDRLRMAVERLNLKPFIKLLTDPDGGDWGGAPDLVINTHFLPASIIARLRKRKKLALPQVTVTTDFETHRMWVQEPCELYFTATDEGAANLQAWGVPAEHTRVTGIPIHPVFAAPKPREQCLARQGLTGERPVVLQLAGGFGVGPVEQIYRAMLSIETPLEIVVVAGRNEQTRKKLEAVECTGPHRCKIIGFTDQIDELMAAADLVVSKPGGLTTSETLARGAAMVVVNPIPGQESRNSDFLLENGAAIKVNNLATLAFKLNQLLASPARVAQLREHARAIARPRAAFDVVEQSLGLLSAR